MDALFARLRPRAWRRLSAGTGTKGERVFDWAWLGLSDLGRRSGKPHREDGFDKWLLARRSVSEPAQVTHYIVFAPLGTTLEAVVGVAGTRWVIETGFEGVKNEAGLDEYEVRFKARVVRARQAVAAGLRVPGGGAGAGAAKGGPARADDELIALSVPEVRRLLGRLILTDAAPEGAVLSWSRWRRRHQARARRCHTRRRNARFGPQLRL